MDKGSEPFLLKTIGNSFLLSMVIGALLNAPLGYLLPYSFTEILDSLSNRTFPVAKKVSLIA